MHVSHQILLCSFLLAVGCTDCYPTKSNPHWQPEQPPVFDMSVTTIIDGGCRANSHCDSGLCLDTQYFNSEPAGTCVPESKIIYVDQTFKETEKDGSKEKPYSDIYSALIQLSNNMNTGPYVRLASSAAVNGYGPLDIAMNRDIAIVGPWADPDLGKELLFKIATGSHARVTGITITRGARVVIDGIQILSSGATSGILCIQGEHVFVQRVLISDYAEAGFMHKFEGGSGNTNICKTITINRSAIRNNKIGINVYNGSSELANIRMGVYNSLVSNNATYGIVAGGNNGIADFRVAYSTVYENGYYLSASTYPNSGIHCSKLEVDRHNICGSLLVDNPRYPSPPDMGTVPTQTNCEITNSQSISNLDRRTIIFESDGFLQKPNMDKHPNLQYIDKLAPEDCPINSIPPVSLAAVDILGTPRPQGAGADYGMHEVIQDGGVSDGGGRDMSTRHGR